MCPKIIDKQAKKQEILQAAMKLFAQKGVANTKMADVAEAAGIGKGTIYEYFKSKDDIFKEAFNHFMEHINAVMAKHLFKVFDPVEKLKAVIAGWVEVMKDTSIDFMEMMMDFWAEGVRQHKESCMFDLNYMYNEYRNMLVSILEEGVERGQIKSSNTKIVASILIGSIDGVMLQWFIDRKLFDLDEAAQVFTDTFLLGLQECE
jgi:TetR/AcrR family fatty acid metabolism transcriptional regulator